LPDDPRKMRGLFMRDSTGATGLEPATSGVTGRRSNQLNYAPAQPQCTEARPSSLAA
jgi:hypothetical protein